MKTVQEPHIDVINAASRMKQDIKKGYDYDEAFQKVCKIFNLLTKEMEQLENLIPHKRK